MCGARLRERMSTVTIGLLLASKLSVNLIGGGLVVYLRDALVEEKKWMDEEEFLAALKEKLGEGGASSKFASLDKSADGKLTKEEYSGGETERKRRKKDK